MKIPKSEIHDPKLRIARMIYRNEETMMEHEREVIQLDEFLGAVAGVYDLMMYAIFFIFGQYISYLSKVKWIKSRYHFQDCTHQQKSLASLLNKPDDENGLK